MSENIASIYIDAKLDTRTLQKQLLEIESKKFSISVNDKALTDLNKHFDLKRRDYDSLQRHFDSKPLRIRVEDSELTKLNRTFASFSQQSLKFPVEIDDRRIVDSINEIKKLFQAQVFQAKVDIDKQTLVKDISEAIQGVSANPNLSINLKLKDGTNSRGSFSEISTQIKNVEKAVRRNKPQRRGLLGNAVVGLQEQFGVSLQREIAKGVKDVFGKEAGGFARKTARSGSKLVKSTFFDNAEFTQASNEAQEILGDRLTKAGYRLGDGIVAALENRKGDITSRVNSLIKAATKDVDFSEVFAEMQAESVESRKKIVGGVFNEKSLRKITEPLGNNLKSYREKAITERALPLVQERALEILQQKRAKNSAKVVNDETNELIIASGGYAGARGLSGARLAKEFNAQKVDGRQAIWIKNDDSDIPKESMSKAQDKLIALLTSISKPNLRGYSLDALEIASQAVAAREINPNITIKILGESGGGFAAEEANQMLSMLGIPSEFIGIGTPNFVGGFDKKDRKIISPDEILGAETNKLYSRVGMANITPSQKILGVTGHPYENYRDKNVAELQNFLQGSPGKATEEQLKDFKAGAKHFKNLKLDNLDGKQTEQLADAAYQNLQHIRRFLLVATDDTKEELQKIVTDFENAFVKLSPESREFSEVRKSLTKAQEYLKFLKKQPGVEASLVARQVEKELKKTQEQFKKEFGNTTGITQQKYLDLDSEISKTRGALSSPSLSLKPTKLVRTFQAQRDMIGDRMLTPRTSVDFSAFKKVEEESKELVAVSENFAEVSQDVIDSEMQRTRTLVSNYKKTYDKFKAAVRSAKKTGNNSEVKKIGDEILKDAALLEAAIKQSKEALGASGIGKTPQNNALNQQLSVISRYRNTVNKEFRLKGLAIPEINKQASNIGANIPDAMAQGLANNSDNPETVMEEIADKVIKKAEKTFEIESPSKVFQRIGGFINQGLQQGISQNTSGLDALFSDLLTKASEFKTNIGNAFGSGSAIIQLGLFAAVLSKIIPLLAGVAGESLEVSNQIQGLEKRIEFISGSKSAGQDQIQQLNSQASKLGLNPTNNLDGVTNLLSASRGTPLALAETTKGQLAVNQAARVYNLTLEEQGRANVALQQILGKGIVQQEELRGQLSEAIPGATQIAARAFGVTTQELNKMITSGLDATEFFRKFTDQLDIETAGGVISALGTNQGKQGLADTKVAKLKKSFGDVLLPAQSVGLDAFNLALDAINATMPITIALTGVMITKMSILAGSVLVDLVKKLLAAQATTASFGGTLKVVRGFLVSALKEFAIVAAIGIGINNLVNQFRDLSGELRGQVNAVKSLQDEYAKLINTTGSLAKSKSGFDVFKDRVILSAKSIVTGEIKAMQDSGKAIIESIKQTEDIFKMSSGSEVNNSLSQLSQIDKALEEVQIKKRALAINNPGDKEGLRLLDNQQTDLLNRRAESTKIPTNVRKQIASQLEATKSQIEYLEKLKATFPLYGDEVKRVDAAIQTLTENSEKLNNAQDDINKKLGESATAFSLLQKSLRTVSDTYADLNDKNTLFNNLQKVQSSVSAMKGGISSEQEAYQNQLLERQANEARLRQLQRQYTQSRALIATPENQQIMAAYNVDFSTGINQLNTLADQVTNIKDKFVFETLAQLKQQELDISGLSVEIINARREAQKQLVDLTKQVSDYYLNISRQSQETSLEIKKISLDTINLRLKNQLRESLTNGYETVIGTLVDGIENALDSFTSAADKAIESQQNLLTTQFGIQDATKTGSGLSRQIPKIEVGLDFSSIPKDNNVVKLREELEVSVGGAENLGEQINFTTATTEELYQSLNRAIEPILEQGRQTNVVRQEIDKANQATNQAANSTLNWNNSITPINTNVQNVNNSFLTIFDTIGGLVSRTGEWLSQLVNAPSLLANIGNGINTFFGGNSTGDGATGGFVSPIKGKSLDELINYKPTRGQGFFGRRDGGKRQHSKVDFDSRVGAGQGAEILAAISGTATARMITPISAGVNIEGKDSKGNNITVVYNHLAAAEINKLFNGGGDKGFVPRQVTAGQRLSTVTMDGLSSGPHLDFGIKVNGKYVEPQKWLATEGKAMVQMQSQMKSISNQTNQASPGGILWGKASNYASSDLSGLTARGKKALEALKNPNVRATLDAIAVAELGESAANKGGYGYLFGDTNGKETFNPNSLASHPKRRVPFGNTSSSATGRYQTMDFVWNEEAGRLGIKDFKPQSQEIMAVSRLMYRGVLDDIMKGNVAGAIAKPGNFDLSSEWASLEGNPYGQGTVGGKRSTFLNNVSRFARQPVVKAANNFSTASTMQLQSSVKASTNQSVATIQAKNQAQQANIQQQIRRDNIAGETALNKVKRQTERLARDSQDSALSRSRELTDLRDDAKVSLTPQEEGLKASTEIFRKKSDTIKQYSRDLEDAKRTIEEANKFIKNSEAALLTETDANRKRVLNTGIQESKKTRDIKVKEVQDLNSKIKQVSDAFDKQDISRMVRFNREAEDLERNKARALTDARFEAIVNPTKQQQNAKNSTDIQRKKQDALLKYQRDLEDARLEYSSTTSEKVRKIKLDEINKNLEYISKLSQAYEGQETARSIRARREQEDTDRQASRELTDAKYAAIAFPTQQQQDLKASTDIQRQQQDALLNLQRALEDAKRELFEATDNQTKQLKINEISELEKKIGDITKAYQGQEKARFDKAVFEEYVRSSKVAIANQTEENNLLQEKIAEIEKIKEIYPTDSRGDVLPALREELAINQLNVEAATKLLGIEEQITRSGNDARITEELSKQLVTLESQNDIKLKAIQLTRQQQEEELRRSNQLRILTIRSKFSEFDSQLRESTVNKLIRSNSKNAFGMDTGDLSKARYESFNSQMAAADIDFQKNIRDIEEFSRENGLTSEQVGTLVNQVEELNRVKLEDLKNQFNDLLDSDKISELQKVRQNLETQFNLTQQPKFDLINAQLDQYTTRGGNEFVSNAVKRGLGKEQELFQRDQALRNLDEQVASARNNGIDIADSQVAQMRDNIVEMSQIKLDNLTVQFKDISTTLGDITKQGLQGFSSGLVDLITKGGSLGSVFDNLFDNILNSVLNMGFNSLLGGLFGGIGLFHQGQIPNFAGGGIHYQSLNKAMAKERSLSGRKPQLAVVHENELIIPANRTEQLASMGLSPEMLLGRINNYASGRLPNNSQLVNRTSENDSAIKVRTEVINKKEYVSVDQLQMAMQEAAKQGAEQGSRKVQMQMQNSTSFRSSVGI